MSGIAYYALEPERQHAKSDHQTIAEVAEELEQRYQLSEKFFEFISPQIEDKFLEILGRNARAEITPKVYSDVLNQLSDWLTAEWREWIRTMKHGIRTQASKERGTPSFIDTTEYFLNMRKVIK